MCSPWQRRFATVLPSTRCHSQATLGSVVTALRRATAEVLEDAVAVSGGRTALESVALPPTAGGSQGSETSSPDVGAGMAKMVIVAAAGGVRQKRVVLPDVTATYCLPVTWYVTIPPLIAPPT